MPISASADAPAVGRRRARASSDEVGGGAAMLAFEAMLNAARALTAVKGGLGRDKASPSRMFEPSVADAHERRQVALREETLADKLRAADDRSDEGGRLAHDPRPGGPTDAVRSTSGTGPLEFTGVDDGRSGKAIGPQETGRATDGRFGAEPGARSGLQGASDAEGAASSRSPMGAGMPSSTTGGLASARATAVAGVDAAASVNGSCASTPARQVAQLLAVGRGSDIDAARGAGPSAVSANARSSDAGNPASGRATANRQEPEEMSKPSTGAPDEKAESTGRSAFDELVRSIRLSGGVRHSSARLELDPPRLGPLHVDVKVHGERLKINVRTKTAAARDLVAQQASRLTAALEQHGLFVDRFDVVMDRSGGGPYDAPDSNGSDGSLFGDQERGEGDRHSPSYSDAVSRDDTAASTAWRHASPSAAAVKARLDIRA